jgi:hypothetical protein
VDKASEKSASEKFYGKHPHWINNLRAFREIAIVSDHTRRKMRDKLDDCGIACSFVGYSDNHAKDCYKLMNINTKGMIYSRDAVWLNRMYGEYFGVDKVKVLPTTNS